MAQGVTHDVWGCGARCGLEDYCFRHADTYTPPYSFTKGELRETQG